MSRFTSARRGATFAAASLLTLVVASPAIAQDEPAPAAEQDDQEIVVTATLRATNLQDIPFSINAQTERDIQRSGATTIEDLSRNVAGLQIQNLGPGQSQVAVRGVAAGQIVRDQPGVKEQVGVYVDDSVISLSLFTPDLDFYDLNRVETLRGPQGTLFGSGSVGGTIRYITNQPNLSRFEGSLEANLNLLDGGDFGGALRGMINAPVSDSMAIRAVGYYTQYGGFVDAVGPAAGENVNDGHRAGGRIAIRLQPAENITITPRIIYQEIRANGFNRQEVYNVYSNAFTTPPRTFREREHYLLLREHFADNTFLADLNINVELGDIALTSISSYVNRDISVSRDASALTGSVSIDLGFPTAAVNLPSNLVDTTDLETFTQEVRLATNSDGPFNFVAGVFYAHTNRFYRQRLPTPGYDAFTDATLGAGTSAAVANGFPANSPYNSDLPYSIDQYAAFGEATWDITDQLHLTAGGRFYDFSETRRFKSGGLFANGDNRVDDTSSSGFSPRLILSYEPADDIRINAQASKGFRLGGVNDPLNLPLCTPTDAALFGGFQSYDDETIWNYEVGVRGRRGGLNFSAAAFYTDMNNLQVTLDAGSCSSRIVFNVPNAHSQGIEVELSAEPVEGLNFSINGTVLEAEFDSTLPGALAATTGIREGNRLPSVPKFQLSASASYEFPIADGANAYFGASYQHVGSRYTQPSDQENNPRSFVSGLPFNGAPGTGATIIDLKLPSYDYVNLSAGIDWDNGFGAMIYVTNLFDENALLSFDRERGGRARLGFNIGQPRVIGITLRKRFGN
ncbi:MAG TPA: TonB-dependent receptor [Allosphingosinicella sp.]|nr:TonB-dependent receptor [Allosphingosinicella sp.]